MSTIAGISPASRRCRRRPVGPTLPGGSSPRGVRLTRNTVTHREGGAHVREVVILSLGDGAGCGSSCGCAGDAPRVPVLTCADALRGQGARVDTVTACSDSELDTALKPVEAGDAVLVVAAATD